MSAVVTVTSVESPVNKTVLLELPLILYVTMSPLVPWMVKTAFSPGQIGLRFVVTDAFGIVFTFMVPESEKLVVHLNVILYFKSPVPVGVPLILATLLVLSHVPFTPSGTIKKAVSTPIVE